MDHLRSTTDGSLEEEIADRTSTIRSEKNADETSGIRSEEIHVRNFDVTRGYDLTLEVCDDRGVVFANRYYLTPGKTASEIDRLDPGEYEIVAELDGRRTVTTSCTIGHTPERTALIEVGNGTVSVTEGLYP